MILITIDKTVIKMVINPTLEIIYYFKFCYSFIIQVGHIVATVRLNQILMDMLIAFVLFLKL